MQGGSGVVVVVVVDVVVVVGVGVVGVLQLAQESGHLEVNNG
jgi:hypothetical protein